MLVRKERERAKVWVITGALKGGLFPATVDVMDAGWAKDIFTASLYGPGKWYRSRSEAIKVGKDLLRYERVFMRRRMKELDEAVIGNE